VNEGALKRRAYISLGANQGDLQETLQAAIGAIRSIERCDFVAASRWYRSAPIDAEGPDFLNGVVSLDTSHDPYGLLLHLLELEIMLGRKRRLPNAPRNAARKVDLDLLLFGDLIICTTPMTLPHPRMHQRAFVLRPLLDLAPEIEIPGLGAAAKFMRMVADQRVEAVATPAASA
jgi:2-amino-4-hydroxy-6-hydroxymethyldihydropteridine diphosphokinase